MFSLNNVSFSALLVLHAVILLLLLTDSCTGQAQEAEPSQTITALEGEDVILPCHLEPAADVVSKSLEWGRLDLEPRFVHVWHEGQNLLVNQNPSYQGRTSLSVEKLKHGDLSLTLTEVKHSDNGRYRCYFPSQGKASTVELLVGSVSSPVIARIYINSSGVVLKCKSKGWYPELEVLWFDDEGNLVSTGPTETVRGPDDLYTVSSRVTVDTDTNRFTCRLQQKDINQTRETHIEVTDNITMILSRYSSAAATVGVLMLSVIVMMIWKLQRTIHHIKTAKNATLTENKAQLQRIQEELDVLAAFLTSVMELKEGLRNQRQKFRQQLEETEREKEENKDKLQLVEKQIAESEKEKATDKTEGYLREKQNLLNAQWKLEKRKEDVEKQQLNMDKLLQKTEAEITRITDKKNRLQNHMELINQQLEEVVDQSDTAHLDRE